MKPLNGTRAMTPEERNARRRELDADPFHRALTRKTAKAWRDRNKDALNAKCRAKYAANPERYRERQRAYAAAHPEARKIAWAKWAAKNRMKLRRRDRLRYADPERRARLVALRKLREATPEGRAKVRAQKRKYYHAHKYDAKGIAWRMKFLLVPLWTRILAEGEERVERYRRRTTVQNWSLFVKWARTQGRYFDPQKNPEPKKGGKTWSV